MRVSIEYRVLSIGYLIKDKNFEKLRNKSSIIHFTPLGPLSKSFIITSAIKVLKLKIKVNKIESESKQEILKKHFRLGKALVDQIFAHFDLIHARHDIDDALRRELPDPGGIFEVLGSANEEQGEQSQD